MLKLFSSKEEDEPIDTFDDNNNDDSFRTCDDATAALAADTPIIGNKNKDHRRLTDQTEDTSRVGNLSKSVTFASHGIIDEGSSITPPDDDHDDYIDDNYLSRFSDEKEEKNNLLDESDRSIEEKDGDNELPLDSFSMLFVAKWDKANITRSLKEYCFPIAVFGIQILIMILIMINLLQDDNRQIITTMNVQVDVPITVKISQYIACMVGVFTAGDLVTGAIYVGRRPIKKRYLDQEIAASDSRNAGRSSFMRAMSVSLDKEHPWKWNISNGMRIVEGALVVVVSFIFICQATTAIDLWLDFAAVQFVGLLDDTAFMLAQNGFLGQTAKQLSQRVFKYEIFSENKNKKKRVRRLRLALFIGIGVFMWAGLSYFVFNQANLTYACRSITVTVGETRHQYARHFSGHYDIQDFKINGRAVYVQVQGRGAFLAYCSSNGINRWTISPLGQAQPGTSPVPETWTKPSNEKEIPQDPCGKIVLQSQRTKTHDVSEIGDSMKFWTMDDADADIKCNMCDVSRKGGDCSFRGECHPEKRLCQCSQGFFGDSCQFSGPCTELVGHDELHGLYNRGYQKEWDLMYLSGDAVMVYDRPVYVQNTGTDIFDVIAFDGGRWFVSQSDYFLDWYNEYDGREAAYLSLANYLINDFNARDSAYIASYIATEPTTKGTPSNIPFKAWLAEAAEDSIGKLGEEEYEFLCADCDNGIPATKGASFCVGSWGEINYDLCKATEHETHGEVNRCACLEGFEGPLCHMRPVEGTASLHLDHATGSCSTCYEDNPWTTWDINQGPEGTDSPCASMGRLFFDNGSETFSREFGLHLNSTHFSVFVSNNDDDNLCVAGDGAQELYSVRRDNTDERIYVDLAVYLDNNINSLALVVKPEQINCPSKIEVDHDVCRSELREVYSTQDMKSMLQQVWLLLHLKITPNEGGGGDVESPWVAVDTEPTNNQTLAVSEALVVSSLTTEEEDTLVSSPTTTTEDENVTVVNLAENATSFVPSNETESAQPNATTTQTLEDNNLFDDSMPSVSENVTVDAAVDSPPPLNTDATPPTSQAKEDEDSTPDNNWNTEVEESNIETLHSSTGSAVSEEYVFAVVPKATENPFFFDVRDGCEARAAALSRQSVRGSVSVKCLYIGSADVDKEEQARVIRELVSNKSVDGVSISVIEEGIANEVIADVVAANIPCITFDSDAPSSKRAAYVGTDNTALGEELAMLLLTRFAASGKYAIVSDDNPNLFLRETGIRTILNQRGWGEVPGSPMIVGQAAKEAASSGPIAQMHTLMSKQPDMDAMIITMGLPMVTGEPGDWESFVQQYPDLLILSADSMPKQIDLLNRGFVNGLVGQQPYDMGSKSIDTLLAITKDKEIEDFIATNLVVMGSVGPLNPYTQLEMSSATKIGFGSLVLLLLLLLAVPTLLLFVFM